MGLTPENIKPSPTSRQLGWFLLFRVFVITLFLGGTIVYQMRGGASTHPALPFLYLLIGISYLHAVLSAIPLARIRRPHFFTQVQVIWDLLFATGLIYVTGGSASIFSFLYLLIIISASIFLSRQEVFMVASAAAILYGSLLDLQFYGYLPNLGKLHFPPDVDGRQVFYAVFIHFVAFFLTAFLSGTASERLRRSERALEKREVDYGELDRLNRAILANITSGLMMVNPQGRIRSFNTAAQKITGYSLEEVYDRDIREIFPNLQVFGDGELIQVRRGEAKVLDRQGQALILGFAASAVDDAQGRPLGSLVTFQDLTQLKVMEEQLKRSDRLAAVGRLASGMAHEIRNPLASISGSVQLMMENASVTEEDKKLMGIVVKEANRLSNLLTDFLLFAKPRPLKQALVDISTLLDDLVGMLSSDPRFSGIEIRREYPPGKVMRLDRLQFRQAMWNLVINSAETMVGKGVLYLGIQGGSTIYVEDTGPGVPEEIRDRIFDPFFTTKDWGTGLGLATVYAIIEMHGGQIKVDPGRKGGARFTIHLP